MLLYVVLVCVCWCRIGLSRGRVFSVAYVVVITPSVVLRLW